MDEVDVEVLDQGHMGFFKKRLAVVCLVRVAESTEKDVEPPQSEDIKQEDVTQDQAQDMHTESSIIEAIKGLQENEWNKEEGHENKEATNDHSSNSVDTEESTHAQQIYWNHNELYLEPSLYDYDIMLTPPKSTKIYKNKQLIRQKTKVKLSDVITYNIHSYGLAQWVDIQTDKKGLQATIQLRDNVGHLCQPQLIYEMGKYHITFIEEEREQIPFSVSSINDYLEEKGIIYGVEDQSIKDWMNASVSAKKEPVVIAQGQDKIDGTDTKFVKLYEQSVQEDSGSEAEENIDWFRLQDISSVTKGEKIIEVKAPSPGEPGTSIYGQQILPLHGKEIPIQIGKGVELSADGRYVCATIEGKPYFQKNKVYINPVYIVQGDLTLKIGSINFTGDVLVKGNVAESLSIQATGNIEVLGSIAQANITAGNHVSVGKNIIGSHVIAGGHSTFYRLMQKSIEYVLENISFLEKAYDQLQKSKTFAEQSSDLGIGRLLQLLIETRLPTFENELKQFHYAYTQGPTQNIESLHSWVNIIIQKMTGFGPLHIASFEELDEIVRSGEEIIEQLQGNADNQSDIHAFYIHNSNVQASGDINVVGLGVYNSELYAGRHIKVVGKKGTVRGGTLEATNSVIIKDLGAPADVKTNIFVKDMNGKVEAEQINAGVIINIHQAYFVVEHNGREATFTYDQESTDIKAIILKKN